MLNRNLLMNAVLVSFLAAAAPATAWGDSSTLVRPGQSRFYRVRSNGEPPDSANILSIEIAGDMISLTWEPFGTSVYRVQYTDDLTSENWSDVPGTTWPIAEEQWSGDDISPPIYYVSTVGNDSNPGTIDQPWRTIQHAAEMVAAGDTVYIRGGTYNEQVLMETSGSAAEGYITFAAYPGETPVIDGTGEIGNNGVLIPVGYIRLLGLEIQNWPDCGLWMEGAYHFEIADCKVHDVSCGIGVAYGAHDFVLNRVEMYRFTLYGFDASPSGGADCYNGTFNDCVAHTCRDPEQNVDGFALGHGTQHGFVFNRCQTYGVFDGFDMSSRNTTLNRCSAHDCMNGGYKIWQKDITLVNCLSYHNGETNVELDWSGEAKTTTLRNCTFVDCGTFNVWVENAADCVHMYNCILVGGDNIALAIEALASYQGDYNVFHNDNAERAIVVWGEDAEFSLQMIQDGDWSTHSGQDLHSLVCSDPNSQLFEDLGNWDFHLREGSIAIDKGTADNAPPNGHDGVSRPQGAGFDIGAYERR